ncbi:hypothetical protein VMT65_37355 [Nocardia sp. CDC153]|uniref:hypothetical protein n=1 Tax=Nocardia sp. CDC153 TaxID=3112167 RepID=UPI002DBF0D2D|nr:hypothetical protein [Nocardia sp. CDC153]MEC3958755.1 hypothetical protein [Nocardia sp. CDC153]
MSERNARARRVGLGVTSFGALAGTLILAAPQAAAWPTDLTVSGGNSHNVGCSYTLTASLSVDVLLPVSFYDNGTEITGSPVSHLLKSSASLNWTPSTTGSHTLTATQDLISKSITVQVDPASSFGSFGCGPSGILNGGSGILNNLLPSISG